MSKDLSQSLKAGMTLPILNLFGKTPCCKETLNKCFLAANTSLGRTLTMSVGINLLFYIIEVIPFLKVMWTQLGIPFLKVM